jgi:hypothetical protein
MRVLSCYPLLGRVHFYLKQPKSNKIKPDNLEGRNHTTMTKIFGQSLLKEETKQEKCENVTNPALEAWLQKPHSC